MEIGGVYQLETTMDNEFVQAYLKVFPHVRPSIFQMEMIVGRITDRDAWNHTLEFWAGNDFRAQSIFKMCHYYDEFIQKRKGNSARVGQWDGKETFAEIPPCPYCNEQYCLKDHRGEQVAA